jgi:glyoxylase-like metal-dependent hydrolase (beta-lactamase superfamily II)
MVTGSAEENVMEFRRTCELAVALTALLGAGATQVGHAQASARTVAEAAAKALGGVDKIRAVKNITLHGYGQYAYQMGGGRISGAPDAPEKYMAANDLTRVFDLEHDRFEMRERRNMLFPFLAPFGHSFALNDNLLDGDIAFDINGDRAQRVPRFADSPLMMDGIHMRRMWMMNNPVALVRTMLDPATVLSAPRQTGGVSVVDITLKQGDKLTAAFGTDHLAAWVRWTHPQTNLGQANLTTFFSGWSDTAGLMMPLGYQTRLDWRNVDFFKLYVDAYEVDTNIANLAAPQAVRSAPEPPSYPVQPVTSKAVAKGIWRISNGTSVIEFKDHLVLFELGVNARGQAKAVIDHARTLAPGKPVTQLIVSHHHFDHTAGFREAVAEGLTIIQRPTSGVVLRDMATHPAPDFPDALTKNPKPLKFTALEEHLRLADETQTLDVYWGRNNGHMADVVFAYAPAEKVLIEGDMVTAAFDWQHWPDTFRDVIAYYHLDVQKISPVHSISREHPDVLTLGEAEELLKGGAERARQHCAAELAKGNYWPGCPIQSKYY